MNGSHGEHKQWWARLWKKGADKGAGSEHNLLVVHVDKANRLVYQLVTLRDIPIPDVKVDHHDDKNIKDQKGNITVK